MLYEFKDLERISPGSCTYAPKYARRLGRYIDGEPWNFITNRPEELVFVATAEWRLTDQHLVEQHTERPPIDILIVFFTLQTECFKMQKLSIYHSLTLMISGAM